MTIYVGFDLYYQAGHPDFDVLSSEAGEPFSFPFSVRTQSIMFDMYRARFTCIIDANLGTPANMKLRDVGFGVARGDGLRITKSRPGIFVCDMRDFAVGPKDKAKDIQNFRSKDFLWVKLNVTATYCTSIWDLFCLRRNADPTPFTWVRKGDSGYWIKGNLEAEPK